MSEVNTLTRYRGIIRTCDDTGLYITQNPHHTVSSVGLFYIPVVSCGFCSGTEITEPARKRIYREEKRFYDIVKSFSISKSSFKVYLAFMLSFTHTHTHTMAV